HHRDRVPLPTGGGRAERATGGDVGAAGRAERAATRQRTATAATTRIGTSTAIARSPATTLRPRAHCGPLPAMPALFRFALNDLPPEAESLRAEVREFLRKEFSGAAPVKRAKSWGGFDREFSRRVGARGWIGMTWPKTYGGYLVNGTKVWTSNAHLSDYAISLFRTQVVPDKKHEGLTQFLVDLRNTTGITIRPIIDLAGKHHFNEVNFTDAFVPDEARVGNEGDGWKQVTTELGFERSGPERYLSSIALIRELVREVSAHPDDRGTEAIGRMVAS